MLEERIVMFMTQKLRSKSIIILSSLALVIIAFSYFMKLRPKEDPELDLGSRIPNNGEYVSVYQNGQKKAVEKYDNGKREGFWVYYYPNGNLKKELNYHNDVLHGMCKFYHDSGTLIYSERYTSGVFSTLTVVNDSLYKYEVEFLEYGTKLTRKHCENCHNTTLPNHFDKLNDLSNQIDSLSATHFNLDTLHTLVTDSSIISNDSLYSHWIPESGEILFNKYDIHAILHYLEAINSKAAPLKFKRINNIKKKPKIV